MFLDVCGVFIYNLNLGRNIYSGLLPRPQVIKVQWRRIYEKLGPFENDQNLLYWIILYKHLHIYRPVLIVKKQFPPIFIRDFDSSNNEESIILPKARQTRENFLHLSVGEKWRVRSAVFFLVSKNIKRTKFDNRQ